MSALPFELVRPIPGGRPGGRLFRQLVNDQGWTCQAKLDGQRCLWTGFDLLTSTGNLVRKHDDLVSELRRTLPETVLDGELYQGELYAFDIPSIDGPYSRRLKCLDAIIDASPALHISGGNDIAAIMVATTRASSLARETIANLGWEGVVFKRLNSPYPTATRPRTTTPDWVKYRWEWGFETTQPERTGQ